MRYAVFSLLEVARLRRDGQSVDPLGRFDIGPELLASVMASSPQRETLASLVDLSREAFGWYSRTVTRAFEGPWIFEHIAPADGRRVLDIGAGVSALPLLLARDGASVVTVDSHPVMRNPEADAREWNDWGFLDYHSLDPRIRSLHQDILDAEFADGEFGVVYSMSVIEHMPARVRRALWPLVHRWLGNAGTLLLTVDLVHGTEVLWPQAEGRPVDPDEPHGDLDAIAAELHAAGFRLIEDKMLRDPGPSAGECAMLRLVKQPSP